MTTNYDRNLMVTAAAASAILGLLEYQRIAGPTRSREDFNNLKRVISNISASLEDIKSMAHCTPAQRDTTEGNLLSGTVIHWLLSLIEIRTESRFLALERGSDPILRDNFNDCLYGINSAMRNTA
jgi:hypothetical protein